MTAPVIRKAVSYADIIVSGDLIACALDEERPNRYLVPDDARRQKIMSAYFSLLAGHAAGDAGDVFLLKQDGQILAVAVWFDHTTRPQPVPDYDQRLTEIVPPDLHAGFAHLDKTLADNHPAQPHAYLAFLAVRPQDQGKGLGTALLTATHNRLDTEGIPAYLEATNANNQALYRRLGYSDLDTFTLEDGSPFHQMWRPAPEQPATVSAAPSPGQR